MSILTSVYLTFLKGRVVNKYSRSNYFSEHNRFFLRVSYFCSLSRNICPDTYG